MNHELIKLFGRLGEAPHAGWVWFALAVQLVISALVFLFDFGFPAWIAITGWVLLLAVIGLLALLNARKTAAGDQENRRQWREQRARITSLQQKLEADPCHLTACESCRHHDRASGKCRIATPSPERFFRFDRFARRSYCLNWEEQHAGSLPD